ncbi:MAG: response regulator [Desulfobacterales bacterium]|nr:response regulator [Desulfobacterales bacterium]
MVKKSLILTVDDKPQNLQFLGKLLSDNGYEVAMAQSGAQALTFLQSEFPDLILLDVMMPEMDGYKVCETLKVEFPTHNIPVIFLTAKSDAQDIVKGFDVGGVDYVTKPFHSAELLARIKTHIELKTLRGLLPMCSQCKKIRDDGGFWNDVDSYFEAHSHLTFTHGLCPVCMDELYNGYDWYKKRKRSDTHE